MTLTELSVIAKSTNTDLFYAEPSNSWVDTLDNSIKAETSNMTDEFDLIAKYELLPKKKITIIVKGDSEV